MKTIDIDLSSPTGRAAFVALGGRRSKPAQSEAAIHRALAHFLILATPRLPALGYVWHTRNESANPRDKRGGVPLDVLQGAALGIRAGVWDWLLIGHNLAPVLGKPPLFYRGLAIELKSARGNLSDEQRAWGAHYQANGWATEVYREWTSAAALLVQWVGGDLKDFEGLL